VPGRAAAAPGSATPELDSTHMNGLIDDKKRSVVPTVQSKCVCACLIFTKSFVHVTYGRGLFLVCWCCCVLPVVSLTSYLHIMGLCTAEVPVGTASQPDGAASLGQWPRQLGLRAVAQSARHAFHTLFMIQGSIPLSQSLPERTMRTGTGIKTQNCISESSSN